MLKATSRFASFFFFCHVVAEPLLEAVKPCRLLQALELHARVLGELPEQEVVQLADEEKGIHGDRMGRREGEEVYTDRAVA